MALSIDSRSVVHKVGQIVGVRGTSTQICLMPGCAFEAWRKRHVSWARLSGSFPQSCSQVIGRHHLLHAIFLLTPNPELVDMAPHTIPQSMTFEEFWEIQYYSGMSALVGVLINLKQLLRNALCHCCCSVWHACVGLVSAPL